jgi:very-short-patch-repair endonuclease
MGKIKCKICNNEVHLKAFGNHCKQKHNIDFIVYIQLYREDFPNHFHNCDNCKKEIIGIRRSKKAITCSVKCLTELRKTWIGDKSPRKGIPMPESGKEKSSRTKKEMYKDKTNHPRYGKIFTEKTKELMRRTALVNAAQPDYINGMQGKTHSPEAIKKIFSHRKMNKLEKIVADILDKNHIEYHFQFFIVENNICKSYDFKLKGKPIIIETDGDFWHGNPNTKHHFKDYKQTQENDILKDQIAESKGYKVLRFWESDILKNPFVILEKLHNYIGI